MKKEHSNLKSWTQIKDDVYGKKGSPRRDELDRDIEEPGNPLLEEILEFYNCEDLLPLARRIIWLSSVKEAVGYIPNYIPMDYEELQCLIVLHDEQNKKMAYENYKMKKAADLQAREQSKLDDAITR